MGFGIALSDGGARGAAHVGVMCALEEANMLPTAVAGTSAASIVAGLYALGMAPHEMREKVKELARDDRSLLDPDYAGIYQSTIQLLRGKPITVSGLFRGAKLEKYLDDLTKGKNIGAVTIKTVITAVDLYSKKTSCLSAYRASGEKLMLTPPLPETAGVIAFNEMVTCMDAGYRAAKDAMPKIRSIFKKT